MVVVMVMMVMMVMMVVRRIRTRMRIKDRGEDEDGGDEGHILWDTHGNNYLGAWSGGP